MKRTRVDPPQWGKTGEGRSQILASFGGLLEASANLWFSDGHQQTNYYDKLAPVKRTWQFSRPRTVRGASVRPLTVNIPPLLFAMKTEPLSIRACLS